MHVSCISVTDRAHKCQRWHFSIPSLRCVCVLSSALAYGLCARCVYIYTISFLRLCICVCIHTYACARVYHCLCLHARLELLAPPDSPTVLTLASTCAAGMGQIVAGEEMRHGINEGERGHRCQQRTRKRVWILPCREHVGVALCRMKTGWREE